MTGRTLIALLIIGAAVMGCTEPIHLQYDYGRAYTEAYVGQADLTRASVANSQYSLYGVEAAEIRIRVRESATDQESGEEEAIE